MAPTFPHADTVHAAAGFPADNDEGLDTILHGRNEYETRLIATLMQRYMRSPEGQTLIVGSFQTNPQFRAMVLAMLMSMPVQHHTHRAQSAVFTLGLRAFSWLKAAIGAVIGALMGWYLVAHYTVTTITYGLANPASGSAVVWAKIAIFTLITAAVGCLLGAIGTRKTVDVDVDVELKMDTYAHVSGS